MTVALNIIARRATSLSLCRQVARAGTCTTTSLRTAATSDNSLTPDKSHKVLSRQKSEYKLGKHRSNALELVDKQAIIEVEGSIAVCDGGGGALGHPLEYIKLGARADHEEGKSEQDGYPCIYCGLRYRSKGGGHGHH